MDEFFTKDLVLHILDRVAKRAYQRAIEFTDPLIPPSEEELGHEEYDKMLMLLERDYCLFVTLKDWVERYVPADEESSVFSEYLAKKHEQIEADRRPLGDNVVRLKDFWGK